MTDMHVDKSNLYSFSFIVVLRQKNIFPLYLKIFPVTVYQEVLGYFTVAIHSLTLSVYCRYLLNLCFNELLDHFSKEHMLNQTAQRKTVPNTGKVVFLPVAPASFLPIYYTFGFCWLFLDSGGRNTGSRMSNSLSWGVPKPHLCMRFQPSVMFASERAGVQPTQINWQITSQREKLHHSIKLQLRDPQLCWVCLLSCLFPTSPFTEFNNNTGCWTY